MSFTRNVNQRGALYSRGSVLVEVIVAIMMLGVFVGGLWGAFHASWRSAVDLRSESGTLATSVHVGRLAEAWSWGPMIDAVRWSPGPLLSVVLGVGCDGETEVGIWNDGWLLGEWAVVAPGRVELGASVWQGLSGSEVILRARKPEGEWGAPWRTVVPDAYGRIAATAVDGGVESEIPVGFLSATTVMHMHGLSVPKIEASWSTTGVSQLVEGLVTALGSTGPGVCSVKTGDRSQSWVGYEGRQLDLFW